MGNQSCGLVAPNALSEIFATSLVYDAEKKIYLSEGFCSEKGVNYCRGIRFSNRLVICYDLGVSDTNTFLNGITLFCWDGNNEKIIARKFWGGCNWKWFDDLFAKEQSVEMLNGYLMGQAKILGADFGIRQIQKMSEDMVEETYLKHQA